MEKEDQASVNGFGYRTTSPCGQESYRTPTIRQSLATQAVTSWFRSSPDGSTGLASLKMSGASYEIAMAVAARNHGVNGNGDCSNLYQSRKGCGEISRWTSLPA